MINILRVVTIAALCGLTLSGCLLAAAGAGAGAGYVAADDQNQKKDKPAQPGH